MFSPKIYRQVNIMYILFANKSKKQKHSSEIITDEVYAIVWWNDLCEKWTQENKHSKLSK